MKLNPTDPLFLGFDISEPFTSRLPSPDMLEAAQVSGFMAALGSGVGSEAQKFLYQQTENATRLVRWILKQDAVTYGLRAVEQAPLASVFEIAQALDPSAAPGIVRYLDATTAALTGVWQILDQALEGFTAAPIIGFIFKIADMILKAVRQSVMDLESAKKKKCIGKNAIAYSKDMDEEIAQAILDWAKASDWTYIFCPYSRDPWETQSVSFTKDGICNGVAFGPRNVIGKDKPNEGLACFPHLAERFGYWNFPEKEPGSTRWYGRRAPGFTQWHPSCTQLSAILWQRVLDYGARMFSVDMGTVDTRWSDFFGEGFELAARSEQHIGKVISHSLAFTWLRSRRKEKKFARIDEKKGVCGPLVTLYPDFTCWTLPDKYLEPALGPEFDEPVSYANLIHYIRREIWTPRAYAALKTIICAYVPPNAPGLKSNPKLRALHKEMRSTLLNRAAVKDVELDQVPDAEYRSDVRNAQAAFREIRMPPSPEPKPGSKFYFANIALIVDDDPPDPPRVGLGPGVADGGSGDAGGGGAAIAALAALGGLLLAR